MKIAKRYRPELVVSKGKGADPILMDPYLDAKADRLVASNNQALVALPVETEKGERSRYLACSLLEAARKLGDDDVPAEIDDQEIVQYGVLWPTQQERTFVDWEKRVREVPRQGDAGTATIHLSPKQLKLVAEAMDRGGGVALTFQVGDREAPIRVEPLGPDPEEFGILMPLMASGEEDVDPDQRCRICRRLLAAGAKCPEHPDAPAVPDDDGSVGAAGERVKDALADLGRTKGGTRVSVRLGDGPEHDLTAFAAKRDAQKKRDRLEKQADEILKGDAVAAKRKGGRR